MLRRISSLTALISFFLTLVTSFVLYIVPAGRVAYWADWRLWGMTKTAWTNLHVNLGILMVIAVIFHTWYNWNSILAYLRNKSRQFRLFTAEFTIALLLAVIFAVGTLAEVPPFSTINKFSEAIKDRAAQFYGEPPYGHAELSSLKTFSKRLGLDYEESLARLKASGIAVGDGDYSLLEIADQNAVTPRAIYRLLEAEKAPGDGMLPEKAPTGMGNRPLADLCRDYGVSVTEVLRILDGRDIAAGEKMTLKQIAEKAGKEPVEIYHIIRDGLIVSETSPVRGD